VCVCACVFDRVCRGCEQKHRNLDSLGDEVEAQEAADKNHAAGRRRYSVAALEVRQQMAKASWRTLKMAATMVPRVPQQDEPAVEVA
jgi:hypothetical protein